MHSDAELQLPALDSLDLNKLRTFHVIAQTGGVSAAARRLALTRSAVSHSLTSLEASLGAPLFLRVGRQLLLTPLGIRLRDAYGAAARSLESALVESEADLAEVRGEVRLGLFPGFSRLRLAAVLTRFLELHPRVRVRVVPGVHRALAERLRSGRLDLTLSLRPGEELVPGGVESERLLEQELVLAMRRRPRGSTAELETFAGLPIVDYFESEPLIDRWTRHHFGRRRIPRERIRVYTGGSSDLALELVREGVGACVLPRDLVEPHRARRELVVVGGPRGRLRDTIWLNRLSGGTSTAAQRALHSALQEGAL